MYWDRLTGAQSTAKLLPANSFIILSAALELHLAVHAMLFDTGKPAVWVPLSFLGESRMFVFVPDESVVL